MKKLLTLLLALVSLGSLQVQACIKRSAAHDKRTPVAVIVMDTTQALLHDAQVKVGSQTFKTSFDGRVILKPEQLKGVKSLTVTCDGFDAHKVKLDGSSVVLVSLTRARQFDSQACQGIQARKSLRRCGVCLHERRDENGCSFVQDFRRVYDGDGCSSSHGDGRSGRSSESGI